MTIEDKQTFADISIIIKMMPQYMQNRINRKFIDFIEENKDLNYVSTIDNTIPLKNQTLSKNTQALLGLIYRDYLCSSSQRESLIREEQENLDKYSIDFKAKKASMTNNLSLVEIQKDGLIKKILVFIKKLFRKILI